MTTGRKLLSQQGIELCSIRVILGAICTSDSVRLILDDHTALFRCAPGTRSGNSSSNPHSQLESSSSEGICMVPLLQLDFSILYNAVFAGLPWSKTIPIQCSSGLSNWQCKVGSYSAGWTLFGGNTCWRLFPWDLPSRFLYYNLYTWRPALTLFAIKFSYKVGHISDLWVLDHYPLQKSTFSVQSKGSVIAQIASK